MGRSSHSLPPTYAPSLVFSHGKKYTDQTFCTIFDESYHVRSIPEMRRMKCVGCCYGWLMLKKYSSTDCYLFNPVLLTKIHLPPLIHHSYNVGILTFAPSDPNCWVVFYSKISRSIIFCRIGGTQWIEQELRRDKRSRELIEGGCDPVTCQGKIYLQFRQAMAVIDIHDTFACVEIRNKTFLDLSFPESTWKTHYLVESCGGIFQVIGIHYGCYPDIIRSFNVYKLDMSTMDWVVVERLDNQIFLLGESSISFSATKLGIKGNCLYFTMPGYTRLHRYDMDDGTITITQPCPNKFPHWKGPFWVVPDCEWKLIKDLPKFCESKDEVKQEDGSLKDLPPNAMLLILSYTLSDSIRFQLFSKPWLSFRTSLLPYIGLESENKRLPWLMSFPMINKGVCTLHDPIFSDTYMMNIPEVAGAIIRDAKFGWLLMSRGKTSNFFFNPYTKETIMLPDLDYGYSFVSISFSEPPTSPDCVVFGLEESNGKYISCKKFYPTFTDDEDGRENTWYSLFKKTTNKFASSYCNRIFYNEVFYCLGKDGKLGIFDPEEMDLDLVWRVLPVPPVYPSLDVYAPNRSFIVEHDGEIVSIFVHMMGKPVWVFKLDHIEMKWVRVESLGEKVVFLSPATCIMVPAGLRGIENRIYFSKFHGKSNIYYSLSTKNYHCFGSESPREDWINTWEHSQCSWIQF